ncbi:MAG: VanZ family protein [Gammaproteobacteria bacterium]|nr:VanZ family protein [Gammaproteobacteria bacterium]
MLVWGRFRGLANADVRVAFTRAAFWIPLALCAGAALSANPSGAVASLSGVTAHSIAFAYLAAALFAAHFRSGPTVAVVLWLLAFGVLIEVAQTFIDGRSGELLDVAVDAVGIAIGCVAYRIWAWRCCAMGAS